MEEHEKDIQSLADEISNRINQMENDMNFAARRGTLKNNNFLDEENRKGIEKSLRELNESIAKMSHVCVKRIDELQKKSESLESSIFEVDGLLNISKDNVGSNSFNKYLEENQNNNPSKIEETNSVISQSEDNVYFDYPGYGYNINTNYLVDVGEQIDQSKDEYLINEITSRDKMPKYWMNIDDYFVKVKD